MLWNGFFDVGLKDVLIRNFRALSRFNTHLFGEALAQNESQLKLSFRWISCRDVFLLKKSIDVLCFWMCLIWAPSENEFPPNSLGCDHFTATWSAVVAWGRIMSRDCRNCTVDSFTGSWRAQTPSKVEKMLFYTFIGFWAFSSHRNHWCILCMNIGGDLIWYDLIRSAMFFALLKKSHWIGGFHPQFWQWIVDVFFSNGSCVQPEKR